MNRILSILFAVCFVFTFAIFAMPAQAAENAVYVCEGGTGDGSSDASPLGSLKEAYEKLGDGGTIVICGSYRLTSTTYEPAHTNPITVTQVYGGKDYRNGTENAVYFKSQGKRYVLAGPPPLRISTSGVIRAQPTIISFG